MIEFFRTKVLLQAYFVNSARPKSMSTVRFVQSDETCCAVSGQVLPRTHTRTIYVIANYAIPHSRLRSFRNNIGDGVEMWIY